MVISNDFEFYLFLGFLIYLFLKKYQKNKQKRLLLAGSGCYFGLLFLGNKAFSFSSQSSQKQKGNTTNVFLAPNNSLAHIANEKLAESFPNLDPNAANFVLFIFSKNESESILTDQLKNFTLKLNETLRTFRGSTKDSNECNKNCISELVGYYLLLEEGLPSFVADRFVSKNKSSTIIAIQANLDATVKKKKIFFFFYL